MFRTVDHALRFAYQMNAVDIVKMSSINSMYKPPWPDAKNKLPNDVLEGLSPQERVLQADMILRVVDNLSNVAEREFIRAMYGRRYDDRDIDKLIEKVIFCLGGGEHRVRGIRKIILTYFGVKITWDEMRSELRCDGNKVKVTRERIYDVLDEINDRSHSEINLILRDKKLVA